MLALIAFAVAQSASPGLAGIWEGQVGTLPVRACFANQEWGSFGAYYYLSRRRLIPLEAMEGDTASYSEGDADPGGPRWRIESADGNQLRARWSQGRRVLPVRMTRIADRDGGDAPCASLDFHRPRLEGVRTVTRRATRDGVAYTVITLEQGDRFEAGIETIVLDGQGAAVQRVNSLLGRMFAGSPPEWFDCVRAPLETGPHEGGIDDRLAPVLITRRWLSATNQNDSFCGGAHPNAGTIYRTFDLELGDEIELLGWFDDNAVRREPIEGSEDVLSKLQPAFRDVVLAGWRAEDSECDEIVRTADYWNVGLTRTGFVMTPSLPHVAQACGDEFTVPFARIRRFLTAEGAANVDALR